MNKIASVVYPYSPKNDDELELKVGDKIEVIGVEEEGWWKGTLKGRVGVFPSNFVQVVETESPTSTTQNISKLNSIFGSRVGGSKNSLSSSNSMNNINSNSINSISNNNNNNLNIHNNNTIGTSNSNNNLIMSSNTHQRHEIESTTEYPFAPPPGEDSSSHSTNSLSERRPRPLRGIGCGDIFAPTYLPLPADPMTRSSTAMASERLGANSGVGGGMSMDASTLGRLSSNTLQKPIPKKPPPPAPADVGGTNGSGPDQAPALPPKPSNQFSPFLQQRPLPNPIASQRTIREQARVIYAYKPSNDDELEMEVDDIIDIIDKNIEDAGWWKGELKGKVGVFPDNFVQLIGTQEAPVATQESNNSSRQSGSTNLNSFSNSNNGGSGGISHHQQQASTASSTEGKIKSVFAGTPKGFSKELESNLEKHSNPAAFLSLKRNKIQQHMSQSLVSDQPSSMMMMSHNSNIESSLSSMPVNSNTTAPPSDSANQKQNGHSPGHEPPSPGKLNHITANRAKGPTRRPPSNILNKRNLLNEINNTNHKYEPSDDTKEDLPPAIPPALIKQFIQPSASPPSSNNGPLASLSKEQQQQPLVPSVTSPSQVSAFSTPPQATNDSTRPQAHKIQPPLGNGLGEDSQPITPKTSQRINQSLVGQQIEAKPKSNPTSTPSTPPWMVELRKTNAEKKRDPLPASATASLMEEIASPSIQSPPTVPSAIAATVIPTTTFASAPAAAVVSTQPAVAATIVTPPKPTLSLTATKQHQQLTNDKTSPKSDESFKPVARTATDEITGLRNDVKKLQEEFKSVLELKDVIETMKIELRACQSATENQRKYIKELVNNLADERKRIAAIQSEIDRNLK